ncbi:hypothetical protein [Desulfocurvibacter africanus]|uniref:hypothetical protein n=1 Tax=Desulfocurvibacter africanus TaxID=873 RepID=UPI000316CC01|nr:hypothetical protein [Desulfocurvibacter africanus]
MELIPSGPLGKAGLALAHGLERLLLTCFDRVSAVSRSMGLALEQKGVQPERIILLPNWADLEVFKSIERVEGQGVLRTMLGVEPGHDRPVCREPGPQAGPGPGGPGRAAVGPCAGSGKTGDGHPSVRLLWSGARA